SGTKHVFSKTSERISIKFLRKSEIYEIQNHHLRIAFQQYQELQECYLVLKEYEIQYIKDLLSILKAPSKKRLYELHRRQPLLLSSLTVKEKISYLNFKNIKEYYSSLKKHTGGHPGPLGWLRSKGTSRPSAEASTSPVATSVMENETVSMGSNSAKPTIRSMASPS